jgi:uncharacterized damage-inducible protein DinB
MSLPFPEPTRQFAAPADMLLGYLDYFRSVFGRKLRGVPDDELRLSRLPSGWSPLQLLNHVTHVERRWLEWGFEGRDVQQPWGDDRGGRWYVAPEDTLDELLAALDLQAAVTRAVVEAHDLTDVGEPGERWDGEEPATLERVLLHLIQEYARHAGHLDVVRELIDGHVGE